MLNYQKLTIDNLSGGLTDYYKPVSNAKWNRLVNFISSSNTSVSTRNGTIPYVDAVNANVRAIDVLGDNVIFQAGQDLSYKEDGDITTLGTTLFDASALYTASARWRNSIIYTTDGNNSSILATVSPTGLIARKASLPKITGYTFPSSGEEARLVSVCLVRKYTDKDGFTFKEYSPEITKAVTANTGTAVTISAISIGLSSGDVIGNYMSTGDTITMAVYITKANGTVLHSVSEEYAFGTSIGFTVPTDDVLDGGIEGFFLSETSKKQVPNCNYLTIVNDTGWYLGVYENGEYKPNRLVQSVSGMPTSAIASAYTDFDYICNGIGNIGGKPIVLTSDAVYRVEGSIGIDGIGSIRKVKIPNSEGGISNNSIVIANDLLYYCGTDGIYATDGFSAKNLTGPDFYKSYTNYMKDPSTWSQITGTFDRDLNIIHWRVAKNTVLTLALDLNSISTQVFPASYDISTLESAYLANNSLTAVVSGPFTNTVVGLYTEKSFIVDNIRRIKFDEDYLFAGYTGFISDINTSTNEVKIKFLTSNGVPADVTGNLYEKFDAHSRQMLIGLSDDSVVLTSREDATSDVVVDFTQPYPTMWRSTPILLDILSAGINYGSSSTRKWVSSVTYSIRTSDRMSVQPYVIVNNNDEESTMKNIVGTSQFKSYDDNDIWERESASWFPDSVVTGRRHLPRGYCRCRHNQLGLRSSISALYNSKDYGLGVVDTALSTTEEVAITVNPKDGSAGNVKLPYDLVGREITVSNSYNGFTVKKYITYQSDDREVIRFKRPLEFNLTTDGEEIDWIIYGYHDNQQIEVMSIDVAFALIANTAAGYDQSKSAEASYE